MPIVLSDLKWQKQGFNDFGFRFLENKAFWALFPDKFNYFSTC
jgi:hypothetical protein